MQYISSDTSVWIDFYVIQRAYLPFRLSCTFLMSTDAIEHELISPPLLGEQLKSYGLVSTEISEEEFYLAQQYENANHRLSSFDCLAMAIAKHRKAVLLTGDGALRRAAVAEGITVIGTLTILDQLFDQHLIDVEEMRYCLEQLCFYNGGKIRLPQTEIDKRLAALSQNTRSR